MTAALSPIGISHSQGPFHSWLDNTLIPIVHKVKSVALRAIGLLAIGYLFHLCGIPPFLAIAGSIALIGFVGLVMKVEEIARRRRTSEQREMLEQTFGGHAAWESLPSIHFDELPLYFAGERGVSARAAVRARMNVPIAKVFYIPPYSSLQTCNVAIKLRDQNRGVETIVLLAPIRGSCSWGPRIPEAHAFLDQSLPVIMETKEHWLTLQAMIEGRHPRFVLAR